MAPSTEATITQQNWINLEKQNTWVDCADGGYNYFEQKHGMQCNSNVILMSTGNIFVFLQLGMNHVYVYIFLDMVFILRLCLALSNILHYYIWRI